MSNQLHVSGETWIEVFVAASFKSCKLLQFRFDTFLVRAFDQKWSSRSLQDLGAVQNSVQRHIARYITDPMVARKFPAMLVKAGLRPRSCVVVMSTLCHNAC
eukprot:808285-Amphidinium_carterae.1